jgi:hypothetical protein
MTVDEALFTFLEFLLLAGVVSYIYASQHIEKDSLSATISQLPNGSCIVVLSDKTITVTQANVSGKLLYICKNNNNILAWEKT